MLKSISAIAVYHSLPPPHREGVLLSDVYMLDKGTPFLLCRVEMGCHLKIMKASGIA
jgi:hypothetical protein